jgi:hypothetical protein
LEIPNTVKCLINVSLVRIYRIDKLLMIAVYFVIKAFQILFDAADFGFDFGLPFLKVSLSFFKRT